MNIDLMMVLFLQTVKHLGYYSKHYIIEIGLVVAVNFIFRM